jgi:Tfp pilus assembly protein PilF
VHTETHKENASSRNWRALRSYHPHIADLVDRIAPFDMEIRLSKTDVPNLYIDDNKGHSFPLYPEGDPLQDLPNLMESLANTKGKIVCILGMGLGIHAVPVVERLGSTNIIVLFEAHPEILKRAVAHVDLTSLLCHPNVRLVVGDLFEPGELLSGELDKLYSSNGHEFVEHKKSTDLATEWYKKARESFERYFNKQVVQQNTVARVGECFFKNRFNNLMAMMDSFPLETLEDRFKGIPSVIVAAGPSLSRNIDALTHLQDHALIIAVDSAVAPLLQKGIKPHLVATVDYNDFTFEKLGPHIDELGQTGLVFISEAAPKIPNFVRFPLKFYTNLGSHENKLLNKILNVNFRPLEDAQSVVHLAIGAAQIMGCDPIIFAGLDLAFTEDRDHVEGTILHWGNKQSGTNRKAVVESIYGDMIPTSPGFLSILEICEKLIRNHPDRTYIDATEGGAKINGTQIMPLDNAIKSYCKKTLTVSIASPPGTCAQPAQGILKELKKQKQEALKRKRLFLNYFKDASKVDKFLKNGNAGSNGPDTFPQNVQSCIRRIDRINIKFNNDEIISYLHGLLVKAHNEYLNHEIGIIDSRSAPTAIHPFIAGYEQQKFVQRVREEALDSLLAQLDRQIHIFTNLLKLERALEKNPDSADHILNLAVFFCDHNYLARAKIFLERLPHDMALVPFFLGCIDIKIGKAEKGMELLTDALEKDPLLGPKRDAFIKSMEQEWLTAGGPKTFRKIMLGRLLTINPSHKKALELKNELEQEDLNQARQYLMCKAKGRVSNKDPEGAIETLSEALAACPAGSAECLSLVARLLIEIGRYDEGLQRLEEAVAIDPQAATLWEELGDTLFESGDYASSITAYEHCFVALPDRIEVLRKIGDCYLSNRQPQAAVVAYEAVLEKDGNHPITRERLVKAKRETGKK